MAKKIRVWDGSAWQDVAPALPYTAVHSAQASMPSTAVDGQIWLDTDASVPSTTVTRWYKLPSAGTTTLSGNDDNSIPLAYTPGYEQVFLNGTLLSRSAADYTATTGTSVVLSSAIVAGDIVEIICPLQITTTDTYTQSATNAAFQANTNNFAAGKNKIINGDFGIWQRGTTSATAGGWNFFPDRWQTYNYGGTYSPSRQTFTPGAAPVAGYEGQYFLRINCTSTFSTMATTVEDVRTLAGQTATISFWAKSNTTGSLKLTFAQGFGSGGSASVDIFAQQTTIGTLGTSWQRYTFTTSIPSVSGKTIGSGSLLFLQIFADASKDLDVWGVQLEAGSNATAFQTATGTLQGELAACQRYYYRTSYDSTYGAFGSGIAYSTTAVRTLVIPPVQMRIAPSSVEYGGTNPFWAWDGVNNSFSATAPTLQSGYYGTRNVIGLDMTGFSGLTQFRSYIIGHGGSGNSNQYIGFSAEL